MSRPGQKTNSTPHEGVKNVYVLSAIFNFLGFAEFLMFHQGRLFNASNFTSNSSPHVKESFVAILGVRKGHPCPL